MKKLKSTFKIIPKTKDWNEGSILTEVLVSVFIFLLISGIIFSILATGKNAWHIEDTSVELQQELRKAMTAIVRDLRQTSSATIIGVPPNGSWYTTIHFQKPLTVNYSYVVWGPQNQFMLGGLNGKQLLRVVSGVATEVIANNINSLQIRRQFFTRDIIEVVLGAEKATVKGTQINNSLSFQLKIRN